MTFIRKALYIPRIAIIILLFPFTVLFLTFNLFPLIFSLFLSFQKWSPSAGLESMHFVGLRFFKYALTDPDFLSALWNTVKISIYAGLPQHIFAIPLAYILVNIITKGTSFLKSAIFLPYITSSVAISIIVLNFFSVSGVLNSFMIDLYNYFGLKFSPIKFFNVQLIKTMISSQVVWKFTGINMVIYMAGMLAIPTSLYEAAELDYASTFRKFIHITLPLLKPYILFATVMTLIGNMQLFEEPMILTKGTGGIDYSGQTVAMYIYKTGWTDNLMGLAAAISWVLFAIIAILTLLVFLAFGKNKD